MQGLMTCFDSLNLCVLAVGKEKPQPKIIAKGQRDNATGLYYLDCKPRFNMQQADGSEVNRPTTRAYVIDLKVDWNPVLDWNPVDSMSFSFVNLATFIVPTVRKCHDCDFIVLNELTLVQSKCSTQNMILSV